MLADLTWFDVCTLAPDTVPVAGLLWSTSYKLRSPLYTEGSMLSTLSCVLGWEASIWGIRPTPRGDPSQLCGTWDPPGP